jgi:hypothetical protein
VAVHRWSAEREEEVEHIEPLKLHDHGHGYADIGIVVLDVVAARRALEDRLVESGISDDEFDAIEHAREILDECILPLLFKQSSRG